MMRPPPSDAEWLVDGLERGGHTVAETLAMASWRSDWADEQGTMRDWPAEVLLAGPPEPRMAGWLRRRFGR
jgi:hypothetical protein